MKCLVMCIYLFCAVSLANAGTVIKGDLQLLDGGDVVFSDGSVQSKAQIQGPVGPQGLQGPAGPANKLTMGIVAKGTDAAATITGTAPNQVLNLTLPQGPPGATGPQGPQGPMGPQGPAGTITKEALCAIYTSENVAPPQFCRKTVFVSSQSWPNGNLGGLSGADAVCQQLAVNAGLAGTYKAWLSDSNISASARMTHSTLPYYTPNGRLIASSWQDLTGGNLTNSINAYENGVVLTDLKAIQTIILTGTYYNGSSAGDNCLNWTNSTTFPYSAYGGYCSQGGSSWSGTGYWDCSNINNRYYAVYCVQQ